MFFHQTKNSDDTWLPKTTENVQMRKWFEKGNNKRAIGQGC